MLKQKSFKKILWTLGLLILVIFIAYYFLWRDIKSKNERISTLSQDISSESVRQDYLILTQKVIESVNTDISRINNSIVAKDGDVSFIENLETLAKSNGLTITIDSLIFEDSPQTSSAGLTVFRINAKTRGNWAGTYTFLSQLESSPFKIKINKFTFLGSEGETLDGKKPSLSNIVWQGAFEIAVLKYK